MGLTADENHKQKGTNNNGKNSQNGQTGMQEDAPTIE